jgi:hypothetical protein
MSFTLKHGMGENFNEKCDLIFTHLYGPLNPRTRDVPMILSGFKNREVAYALWAGASSLAKCLLGTWGAKKDQAVWVVNAPKFECKIDDLVEDETTFGPGKGCFPLELCQRLLEAYPGEQNIVADPFMGRGTVGKAVQERGGIFIGVDRDAERVRKAQSYLLETL